MKNHYILSFVVSFILLSGCDNNSRQVNSTSRDVQFSPNERQNHQTICGFTNHFSKVVMDDPLEKYKLWFLDVSYFTFSRVVRDSTDSNNYILVVDYDMSIGAPFSHWIIYESERIIFKVQWSLNRFVDLPVEQKDFYELIKIPNHQNRPVFISDETNEKRVEINLQFTELDIFNIIIPNNNTDISDPFKSYYRNDITPHDPFNNEQRK